MARDNLTEITKQILNRKTFHTIYFDVNENYNIYGCSEVNVRSRDTNTHLYMVHFGGGKLNKEERLITLYKFKAYGNKKELFSEPYSMVEKTFGLR